MEVLCSLGSGKFSEMGEAAATGLQWIRHDGRDLSLSHPNVIRSQHLHLIQTRKKFGNPSRCLVSLQCEMAQSLATHPDTQGYNVYLTKQNSLV